MKLNQTHTFANPTETFHFVQWTLLILNKRCVRGIFFCEIIICRANQLQTESVIIYLQQEALFGQDGKILPFAGSVTI